MWFSRIASVSLLLWLAVAAVASGAAPIDDLPKAAPAAEGMSAERLEKMDALIQQGIQDKKMPGCVVCVGRHGRIVWLQAYGNRQLVPEQDAMTTDTVFDLASLTKPIATATCIMRLVDDGKLRLGDRIAAFFPAFGNNGKEQITVRDLLLHQSGLVADNPLSDYADGPAGAGKKSAN